MVIGRALGKTAEHDMRNAALSGANLRGDDANRDARCPIGWKSIDAGRYCREGKRCEPVRRRKIEGGAITGREQLLLASMSAAPDRADGMDDMPRRQAIAAGDFCRTGFQPSSVRHSTSRSGPAAR